eukprot:m.184432 g.184432  ORF g.184432 m.184432 type:complete len:109 (-) comp10509_c0_seq3:1-327(-)
MGRFPHLRLVWSRSAYATAKTFRILKRHQPQPDASTAAEHGEDTDAVDREGYASGPQAFLRMLPGVTAKNIRKIMEKTTNLKVRFARWGCGAVHQTELGCPGVEHNAS